MHYHHYYFWLPWCHSNTSLENAQLDANSANRKKNEVHGRHQTFAKNENDLENLIQTVRIYSQDIRMEVDVEKCAMPVMKNGKGCLTEGVKLPNQVVIRTLGEKETYKYLGILEADTINQEDMKEKIKE